MNASKVNCRWAVGLLMSAAVGGQGLSVASAATRASPSVLFGSEALSRDVVVRDLQVHDGAVSGVVVNNTGNQLTNVDLLVRFGWRWKHERAPGKESPGRAVVRTLENIPLGGETPFNYSPEFGFPARSDGHYEISVVVVGYTQFR